MRLLVDMNLSPEWVPYLRDRGVEATHWSEVGKPNANDSEIMEWARNNRCAVFTHDLDFGILLAHTSASGPSVIQARTQDPAPGILGPVLVATVTTHQHQIERGVLLTVDVSRSRVRLLPIAGTRNDPA